MSTISYTHTTNTCSYVIVMDTTTKKISITDTEGHWAGNGRWDGEAADGCIVDADAQLSPSGDWEENEALYDALEEGLRDQLADLEEENERASLTEEIGPVAELIRNEVAECIDAARREGAEYSLTREDCMCVVAAVKQEFGRGPTKGEWVAAGFPDVGGAHYED